MDYTNESIFDAENKFSTFTMKSSSGYMKRREQMTNAKRGNEKYTDKQNQTKQNKNKRKTDQIVRERINKQISNYYKRLYLVGGKK